MVSAVPSIIPILTANAVAANQVKRKNKSLNNKKKELKDSPLNDKVNCRVFLNNGKVIEGHYEGNWYEDNSDEEGIWIKTDNGIEEINSKDYDRIEHYHKKTIKESYIKAEKGNIYYTKNSDMFLSMVKSIFISKNIPVRVYYDTIKQMYVFGNAFDYIHADLATGMKYYSKIYGVDEMRANVSYLRQNCALFQVLPDDDFKKYDMGDGYTDGWFLKIDDLIFACRHKQYHKVRDEVPLFKDHISEWIPTDYYIAKKQGLTESVDPKLNNNFWKWFGNSKVVDKKGKPLVVYHGSGDNNIQEFDPSRGFNVDAIYFSDKLSVASHWSGDYLVKKKVQIEETEDVNKLLKTLNEFVKAKIVNYDGYYRLDLKYDDGNESSSPLGEKIDDRYYQKGDGTKTDLVKILQRDIETFAFKSENSGNYACYLSIQKPLEIYAGKKPYWKIEFMGKEVNTETIASYAKQNGYDGAIIYDVYETDYENQLCNDYIVFDSRQIKSVYNNGEWSLTSNNINESVEEKMKNYSDDVEKLINKTLNESYTPDWIQDLMEDYSCYEILEMFRNGEKLWNNLIQPEPYKKALSEFIKYGELLHFPKDKVFDWFKIIVTNTIKMTSMSYLAGHEGSFPYDDVKDFLGDDDLPNDFSVLCDILKEKGFYTWSKLPNGDISWSDYGLKPLWKIINEYNDNMSAEEVLVLVNRALDVTHWNGDLSSAFIIGGAKTLSKISNESINKKGKIINESVEDKILYIIRGVPGSGKSTLAHKLTDNVVEADQYFYDDKGNYNWSADKLNQAHNWCFYTVKKYMEEGRDKIAVANTFVKNKDYKRYVELAKEFGYKVDIRTCTGNYQNIHNVPDETVEKIRSKFQETPLDESAENDKTLRDYAVKLANICLDALVKTKYETKISNKQIQINVDKAFKKAVPMLKNSPYEYFIILASKNDEPNASYGKTVDRKYGLITLPVFSKDPIDQTLSILYKHKSILNKLYSTYSGDELKLKINEYAIKYLKKELEKSLSNFKSIYLDILIHECTHLLDDVRRTKTYKSKEQNLKDDKGIKDYFNSPEEQNAFYQETVSIFDEWANQSVGYKTFDIFWDDFIRQYRGEYNMLNDKNKRKLKKRAYAYWYVYMKD